MTDRSIELKFLATPDKGEVSAILMRPEGGDPFAGAWARGKYVDAACDDAADRGGFGGARDRDVSLQLPIFRERDVAQF